MTENVNTPVENNLAGHKGNIIMVIHGVSSSAFIPHTVYPESLFVAFQMLPSVETAMSLDNAKKNCYTMFTTAALVCPFVY